ncbi:uncharacterized protein Ibf2 [Drosophila tropicalis]|uniref:uncharacterized protein Ibf2 n=1 Tax=Drosophila tropicalis TaxID=46794 RepID=UPI0035ABBF6B
MKSHNRTPRSFKAVTWKRLGFLPSNDKKKYRAFCIYCKKNQANTSIGRLVIHRKSCTEHKMDLTEEFKEGGVLSLTEGSHCLDDELKIDEEVESDHIPEAEPSDSSTTNIIDKLLEDDDTEVYVSDIEHPLASGSSQTDANRLQKDLIKAETEYLEAKAAYFDKLHEISDLRRTLTMLEAKKTQLEIIQLKAECE